MTKPESTLIVALLDRSGSMSSILYATKEGFDAFVAAQRAVPGKCRMTLVQFDAPGIMWGATPAMLGERQVVETLYRNKPIAEVPALELIPRGGTPLYDALASTIDAVGADLAATPDHKRPSKVIFVVVTDGQENSSWRYTAAQVRERVEHQRTKYQWEFVYLGANQDAILTGQTMGIPVTSSILYGANTVGTQAVYGAAAAYVTSSRIGNVAAFTDTDRALSVTE